MSDTASDRQLDLFAAAGHRPDVVPALPAARHLPPAELGNDALLDHIRRASIADCHVLAMEAARRRLNTAIPALDELCRRFKGFGLRQPIPEQLAALEGLALIGGIGAAQIVARMITEQVVHGPGLAVAAEAAVRLGVRLPPERALPLLRDPEPRVRAAACRCARSSPDVTAVMVELLGDLHVDVSRAAACALARLRRPEARLMLLRLLCQEPSAEIIDAAASLGDEECLVLLGRIGRARSDLADAVLAALDEIEAPRATAIAASVRRSRPR
jgi:HEAT repeats